MTTRRNAFLFTGILLFLALLAFSPFGGHVSHATTTTSYTLLEPLPGLSGNDTPTLIEYISAVYKLVIGFAGVLAVVIIIVSGIQLIFAGVSPSAKNQAKKQITGAIGGLILILLSWLILYTINPALLTKGFELDNVGGATSTPSNGSQNGVPQGGTNQHCYSHDQGHCYQTLSVCESKAPNNQAKEVCSQTSVAHSVYASGEQNVRNELSAAGISVNKSYCETMYTRFQVNPGGCTNVGTLPPNAIQALKNLKQACDAAETQCQIEITGGTEKGHTTHDPFKPIFDLHESLGLDKYFGYSSVGEPKPHDIRKKDGMTCHYEGSNTYKNTTAQHWHCVA